MKIRSGFVSNSSSSSFVVALSVLTDSEKEKILGYSNYVNADVDHVWTDDWNISVNDKNEIIYGSTYMDNGDLKEYLGEEIYNKFSVTED